MQFLTDAAKDFMDWWAAQGSARGILLPAAMTGSTFLTLALVGVGGYLQREFILRVLAWPVRVHDVLFAIERYILAAALLLVAVFLLLAPQLASQKSSKSITSMSVVVAATAYMLITWRSIFKDRARKRKPAP